jgi:thiol-disulfide isomerase/thioredoxin
LKKPAWSSWLLVTIISALLGAAAFVFLSPKHSDTDAKAVLEAEWRMTGGQIFDKNTLKGQVIVINFWASWCPPCVEEMPELARIHHQYASKSVQLIGIGVDSPSNIAQFLKKTPIDYPIILGGLNGSSWAKMLGNSSAGLPFTVVIDRNGVVKNTKLGKISEDELKSWIDRAILTQ